MANNFFDSSVFEISSTQYLALAPYLILCAGIAVTCIMAGIRTRASIVRSFLVATLGVFAYLQLAAITQGPAEIFGTALEVDVVTRFTGAGVAILAILCALFVRSSDEGAPVEWAPLMLLSVLGLSLLPGARDWVAFFVALETLAISGYILTAIDTHREKSLEAGLKYLLMGSFASALFLMGAALLYGLAGTFNFDKIHETLQNLGPHQRSFAVTGALLIVISLAFKVALFPFHMWAPDVYQSAPTGVAAFLASATKLSVFAALAVSASSCHFWDLAPVKGIVISLSVASIILGSIMAVAQTQVRRLLAYASIVSAGYAGLALTAGPPAYGALMLYLFVYGLGLIASFAAVEVFSVSLGQESHEDVTISQLSRVKGPASAWAKVFFVIAVLSLAGIPPLPGFLTKYSLLKELWSIGDRFSSVIIVLGTFLGLAYYLKLFVPLYLEKPEASAQSRGALIASPRIIWSATVASSLALIVIIVCLGGFSRFFQWMSLAEGFAR